MKRIDLFVLMFLTAQVAYSQTEVYSPQTNVRKAVAFSQTYSCRSDEDFHNKGYDGTALFLSDSMKKLNSPDLVFNGACGSKNYFESATHGANYSVIADITATDLTSLLLSLSSIKDKNDFKALEKLGFKDKAAAVSEHSYVVLLNKHGINGMFVFTVTDLVPDRRAVISYEVLDYQITSEYLKELKTLQSNSSR